MIETWVNNRGFTQTATYHKTKLMFREAAYETLKDIKARTNKTLILPLSGGSDGALIYNIAKDLGIEVKTVHQRYWCDEVPLSGKGDRLINEYENKHIDPDTVDVYQDIDCSPQGEFRTSQWLKDIYEDYYPTHWWVGLQPWITKILDPDNDFIIWDGFAGVNEWNYQNNSIKFCGLSYLAPRLGFKEFENAGFICDNPIILYTLFDQTSRDITKKMMRKRCAAAGNIEFEPHREHSVAPSFKKTLFEHHFPEFDHLLKLPQQDWPWPENIWRLRKEYGESRGYVPDHTGWSPMKDLDLFFEYIDNNIPITSQWREWNWNLSDYGKQKLQYKIFTDKIEYFPASTPQSENLI